MKDQIDWKAQAENMKEIAGIVGDLIKETDWKDVAKAAGKDAKGIKKRLMHEAELLKNMSPEEVKARKEALKEKKKQLQLKLF